MSGSAEANILLGGSANDTIKLGQGGDKVEGGSGDDIFEVDVDAIPLSGSTIRDLKPNDIIKFTSSGQIIPLTVGLASLILMKVM